ncbi:MAG: hypothetical protein IJW13_01570 [Clostridia bacterium]|nr:hypothetical protein [Clostridia bacterium]
METILQAVIVVFMLFLCAICLFAVVVIARDIVYETARRKESREEREAAQAAALAAQAAAIAAQQAAAPVATAPVAAPIEEAPTVSVSPVIENPLAEASAEEPSEVMAEAEAESSEASIAEELPATEAEAEVTAEEVLTEAPVAEEEEEVDPDAVSFSRVSLTMEEKYATLSTEFKRYFDDIIKHALSKEGVHENKRSSSYDYKIGAYRVLRIMIKRSEIVCEFNFIDREVIELNSAGIRMKQAATVIRITEPSAVGVAKDCIDLVCTQIAEDKEYKKDLARAKRREKRRLAKEEAAAAEEFLSAEASTEEPTATAEEVALTATESPDGE